LRNPATVDRWDGPRAADATIFRQADFFGKILPGQCSAGMPEPPGKGIIVLQASESMADGAETWKAGQIWPSSTELVPVATVPVATAREGAGQNRQDVTSVRPAILGISPPLGGRTATFGPAPPPSCEGKHFYFRARWFNMEKAPVGFYRLQLYNAHSVATR
jgi:hypothetical protein